MKALFGVAVATLLVSLAGAGHSADPPQTGFEATNGATWTTFDEEQAFLRTLDATPRVALSTIGVTSDGKPVQLVVLGHPAPTTAEQARTRPTLLFTCTQHGNEPAGREACLMRIRDLAFTEEPVLVDLLRTTVMLYIPTANPEGREANARGNSGGTDINRDHLTLETPEAQAVARVVRDWQPDMALDLHEYGPSQPVVYDDNVLYLWPRNLNTDQAVHDVAKDFALNVLKPCVEDAGYTADEYGQTAVGDVDLMQTAGDADEGIMRNLMGLRHTVGILIETAVTADPRNSPTEPADTAETQRRRVASHHVVIRCTEGYLSGAGQLLMTTQDEAAARKTAEGAARSAPLYFGGADNDPPEDAQLQDPPPCAYDLNPADAKAVATTLDLQGATRQPLAGGRERVLLGQRAEPLLPLLLDARGTRHAVEGTPIDVCPAAAARPVPAPRPAPAPKPKPAPGRLPTTGTSALAAWVALAALVAASAFRRLRLR